MYGKNALGTDELCLEHAEQQLNHNAQAWHSSATRSHRWACSLRCMLYAVLAYINLISFQDIFVHRDVSASQSPSQLGSPYSPCGRDHMRLSSTSATPYYHSLSPTIGKYMSCSPTSPTSAIGGSVYQQPSPATSLEVVQHT